MLCWFWRSIKQILVEQRLISFQLLSKGVAPNPDISLRSPVTHNMLGGVKEVFRTVGLDCCFQVQILSCKHNIDIALHHLVIPYKRSGAVKDTPRASNGQRDLNICKQASYSNMQLISFIAKACEMHMADQRRDDQLLLSAPPRRRQ